MQNNAKHAKIAKYAKKNAKNAKKMQKMQKKQIIQKMYKRTKSKSLKHAIRQSCNYVRQKAICTKRYTKAKDMHKWNNSKRIQKMQNKMQKMQKRC